MNLQKDLKVDGNDNLHRTDKSVTKNVLLLFNKRGKGEIMTLNGFEGIDLYRGGNGFFNEWAPVDGGMSRPAFTPIDNTTLQGGLNGSVRPQYTPVGDADAIARYNQQIANARNLQLARQYIQP